MHANRVRGPTFRLRSRGGSTQLFGCCGCRGRSRLVCISTSVRCRVPRRRGTPILRETTLLLPRSLAGLRKPGVGEAQHRAEVVLVGLVQLVACATTRNNDAGKVSRSRLRQELASDDVFCVPPNALAPQNGTTIRAGLRLSLGLHGTTTAFTQNADRRRGRVNPLEQSRGSHDPGRRECAAVRAKSQNVSALVTEEG